MEMRRYKDTSEKVSLLGFGSMRLPRLSEDTQEIDSIKAKAMVAYAVEHGVNYFDTGYGYHNGMSETFLREALDAFPRGSYNLADKLPIWLVKQEADVPRLFGEQLKRCGVDYFDYYLIHNLSGAELGMLRDCNVYAQLQKLKEQGKIKKLGFSFHDVPSVLQTLLDSYTWDFAQIQLNYLDWEEQDAKTQYQLLSERGIPVIIMEPLRGGTLTALSGEAAILLHDANPVASPASWGMRFAASLPGVLTVLSGMSEPEHVWENVNVMEQFRPLSNEEYSTLNKVVAASRLNQAIPCTACHYCMDCPAGVDIPKVFGAYNRYLTGYKGMTNSWGDAANFAVDYRMVGSDKQAEHCVACGKCAPHCPQKIDIPEQMQIISAFAANL